MSKELDEAERRIYEHPAYKVFAELEAFGRTLNDVFSGNLAELFTLLDQAATDPDLAFELIQNVHDDSVRERFRALTIQRLHNYLASTMSLVEHARRLLRKRSGPIADDHEARKLLLLANDEVPFMMDLRVFTQHRRLPVLGHRLNMTNVNTVQATFDSEVELEIRALLAWDGWTARSHAFLEQQGEAVVLRPIVRKHGELVFAFNSKLHNALARENEPGLAEVNRLIVERNAVLMGGASFEGARAYTERIAAERQKPRPAQSEEPSAPTET